MVEAGHVGEDGSLRLFLDWSIWLQGWAKNGKWINEASNRMT